MALFGACNHVRLSIALTDKQNYHRMIYLVLVILLCLLRIMVPAQVKEFIEDYLSFIRLFKVFLSEYSF
jgi:hypothetical protein